MPARNVLPAIFVGILLRAQVRWLAPGHQMALTIMAQAALIGHPARDVQVKLRSPAPCRKEVLSQL